MRMPSITNLYSDKELEIYLQMDTKLAKVVIFIGW